MNKDEQLVPQYYQEGDQFTLFAAPTVAQKMRGGVVDDIMSREITSQAADFESRDVLDTSEAVTSKIMLSYEGIEITGRVQLTPFDREVIDAVATLSLANEYVTSSTIFRVMSGKTKNEYVGYRQRARVIESMDKCAFSKLTIRLPQAFVEAHNDEIRRIDGVYSGQLLAFEKVTANSSRGPIDCYKLLAVPALFRYARSMGKISEFPIAMLDTPPAKTERTLLLQGYLLRRIDAMNRKEEPLSKILWRDVYEALGMSGAVRQHQMRVRETAKEIIAYWEQYEFFRGCRLDSKSNGGILITPNYDFRCE
ncbi:MAG: hypothetical protein E7425_10480 [Ruminococcaceae bacterium]|nr:hypothetical protein [Oscillospiraceae bacterium]